MKTIRQQARLMGHAVVGYLRPIEDDVFTKNGVEVRNKRYTDSEGTEYSVNRHGELVYIATRTEYKTNTRL